VISFVVGLFVAFVVLIICLPVATSGVKTGIGGRAYRNTGTYGTPVWTAANIVRDATVTPPWDYGDASARFTRAKQYGKTQMDLGIQLVCRADDADAGYGAFVDAAVSPTTLLDMLILDGAITTEGCRGFRAHWLFSISGQPQAAGDVIYSTFDLKPGVDPGGNVPQSVVMGAASAPTFTPI